MIRVRETSLFLLAAGFGTRLDPLTREIPKALLPLYGVPLLDLHLRRWLRGEAGEGSARHVARVVVNGHHHADRLREHLAGHPLHARIAFSHEPRILGTGGALGRATGLIESDPFLVLNADALFPAPLAAALRFHQERDFLATMIVYRGGWWPNVRVAGDRVRAIRRGHCLPGGCTFTGAHIISRALLARLPANRFHDIRDTYDLLAREERLGAFSWEPEVDATGWIPFLDLGTPESYLEAHRRLAQAGARTSLALPLPDLDPRHQAEGYGYVAPSARVGAEARIAESVVLAGARIAPGAHLRRVILGPGAEAAGLVENRVITRVATRPLGEGLQHEGQGPDVEPDEGTDDE